MLWDSRGRLAHRLELPANDVYYATAIRWIKRVMVDRCIFNKAILKTQIALILVNILTNKRRSDSMMRVGDNLLHLSKSSNFKALWARTTLEDYFKRLEEHLFEKPEVLRRSLFTFDNTRALFIANVEKLPDTIRHGNHSWPAFDGRDVRNLGVIIVPITIIDSSN